MPETPEGLQDLLDELESSRASRRRAWENLQEIRWVFKDTAGVELPPPEAFLEWSAIVTLWNQENSLYAPEL